MIGLVFCYGSHCSSAYRSATDLLYTHGNTQTRWLVLFDEKNNFSLREKRKKKTHLVWAEIYESPPPPSLSICCYDFVQSSITQRANCRRLSPSTDKFFEPSITFYCNFLIRGDRKWRDIFGAKQLMPGPSRSLVTPPDPWLRAGI